MAVYIVPAIVFIHVFDTNKASVLQRWSPSELEKGEVPISQVQESISEVPWVLCQGFGSLWMSKHHPEIADPMRHS